MAIYRIKRFSSMADEDFEKESNDRKKKATSGKWIGTAGVGALGGLTGAALGHKLTHKTKGTLIGAGIGALSGTGLAYLAGHHNEKKVHKRENDLMENYKNASDEDKEYIRNKEYRRQEQERAEQLEEAIRSNRY